MTNTLRKALERLSAAALARDSTMGDPCALLAAKAELADANKAACEALAAPQPQPRMTVLEAVLRASPLAMPAPPAAPAPAVPDGAVPPGSWEHLKVLMRHSAWEDTVQLSDALANIDDFAKSAAPAVPLTDEQVKPLLG